MTDSNGMGDDTPRRVLLKLSGEALGDPSGIGYDVESLGALAAELANTNADDVELAVVVGGGNLFRGKELSGSDVVRDTADNMGMLATVMNALALRDVLRAYGNGAEVLTGLRVPEAAEVFTRDRAEAILERGDILLFAGGTGHPYFTTDTAAALRACQIEADLLLKATKVDGVYTADPELDRSAEHLEEVTFGECLERNLGVMDQTAFALCRENELPIVVFDMRQPGRIAAAARGERVGSRVVPE